MPIVVNTNSAATTASFNLSKSNEALRKSLGRLSSGKRITSPADDAGGLAVALKLASKTNRTTGVIQNVQNSISYLQVQDSSLQTVGKILDRMAELRTMAQDITKNTGDIENYSKEFVELQSQLKQIKNETFNGISLFSSGTANVANDPTLNAQTGALTASVNGTALNTFDRYGRTLYTHPGGQTNDGSISINVTNLEYVLEIGTLSNENSSYWDSTGLGTPAQNINLGNVESDQFQGVLGSNGINSDGFIESIMAVSVGQFTAAIERLADVRAENGAEQNRALQVIDMLQSSLTNLEAAHGRIMDADIALESTRFARHNVLVQAGAAMTAQANQLTNVALSLIG
ncbi:MAG: flagellin [Opitutae bacterium]|jgi:flagellin|nr:flagellin [Opitutae bacterium]MBT7923495.1 flagellin [Opitutae bacterium]